MIKRNASTVFIKQQQKSFAELVGAMGLKNPSELSPSRIIRRIDEQTVKSLDDVYQYTKSGELLSKDSIPERHQQYWQQAQANRF